MDRNKGIGGSDIASILGLNRYKSPYQLWFEKTQKLDNTVDNKYTRAGKRLEAVVADMFAETTGFAVEIPKEQVFYKKEYLWASPDRLYRNSVGFLGVLECKATQKYLNEPLDEWVCQLQWYMGIIGTPIGSIAWLERGIDFQFRNYEFDRDFFQLLLERAEEFWNENVLKGIPPAPLTEQDIRELYPRSTEKKIQADEKLAEKIDRLKSLKEIIKRTQEEADMLEEQIKLEMLDAEAIEYNGEILCTWKSSKDVERLDINKFRNELPEIYVNYIKRTPQRIFRI